MKYSHAISTFSKLKCFYSRTFCSKVPAQPVPSLERRLDNKKEAKVDQNTITLLERLSLVKTDPEEGVKILEDSIAFANQILHIDTDHVQPLYSVLEERNLSLRPDKVTQGNCQKDILKNASVKEDDYFVAPLGNIPLHEVEVEDNRPTAKQNEISSTQHSK